MGAEWRLSVRFGDSSVNTTARLEDEWMSEVESKYHAEVWMRIGQEVSHGSTWIACPHHAVKSQERGALHRSALLPDTEGFNYGQVPGLSLRIKNWDPSPKRGSEADLGWDAMTPVRVEGGDETQRLMAQKWDQEQPVGSAQPEG